MRLYWNQFDIVEINSLYCIEQDKQVDKDLFEEEISEKEVNCDRYGNEIKDINFPAYEPELYWSDFL